MVYGIKICADCCGFGIVLTPEERVTFWRCLAAGKKFDTVKRTDNEIRQCPVCRGKAWTFVPNHKNISIPTSIWRRK